MYNLELAKLKMERAIKYSERFESMNEEEFKRFISFLGNVLYLIPSSKREKAELHAYVDYLSCMDFKKYGFIFKGISRKGGVILTRRDVDQLVWTAHSFLF